MTLVWLSLGSNLLQPSKQIFLGIEKIKNIPRCKLISVSSYYKSKPLGNKNQPNFINTVILINTSLNPNNLLYYIQLIEKKQGRIKSKEKWGPRTLDIDIILFDTYTIKTKQLNIPHYDMLNRDFVLNPLFEISPDIYLPNEQKINKYIQIFTIKKQEQNINTLNKI